MKTKAGRRILSLLLCIAMTVPFFSGCGTSDGGEEGEGIEGIATEVEYNTGNKYTTTLTVEKADFSKNIAVEDISIQYTRFEEVSEEKYASLEKITDPEGNELYKIPDEYTKTTNAEILDVVRKDSQTLEISFKDDTVAEALPEYYTVLVNKDKTGRNQVAGAFAAVRYPDTHAVSDIDQVLYNADGFTAVIKLPYGNFTEDIKKEDLSLGDAFENMEVASLETVNGGIKIEVTGTPDDTYMNGAVSIPMTAVENGVADAVCTIPLKSPGLYDDISGLQFKDGVATVPVSVFDATFTDKVGTDSFTLTEKDGVSIEEYIKKNETQGELKLKVAADSIDEAAEIIDGCEITVADDALSVGKEITHVINAQKAQPTVVFDYVEEKDGAFTFTLLLSVYNGSFKELTKEKITLGGDFSEAQNISLSDDGTLIFSVPTVGESENPDMTATLTFAAGSIENRWGTESGEITVERGFSQETLGKGFSEFVDTITNFLNTPSGIALTNGASVVGGVVALVNFGHSVAQWTGLVSSPESQNAQIINMISALGDQVKNISVKMDYLEAKMDYNNNRNKVEAFNSRLNSIFYTTESYNRVVSTTLNDMLATMTAFNVGKLHVPVTMINVGEQRYGIPRAFYDAYKSTKAINTTAGNKLERWEGYYDAYDAIMAKIGEAATAFGKIEVGRSDVSNVFKSLCRDIIYQDLLKAFDNSIDFQYNFASQTLKAKEQYRQYVSGVLQKAATTTIAIIKSQNSNWDCSDIIASLKSVGEYMDRNLPLTTKSISVTHNGTWTATYVYNNVLGSWVNTELAIITQHSNAINTYGNLADESIKDYIRRLNGKTVREDLVSAGINVPNGINVTKSLNFRVWRDDDPGTFYGHTYDYTRVIALDDRNPKITTHKSYNISYSFFSYDRSESPVYSFSMRTIDFINKYQVK